MAAQYYNALESSGQIEVLAGMSVDEMDELFDLVELPEKLIAQRQLLPMSLFASGICIIQAK